MEDKFIPYGRQEIGQDDIDAVTAVLKSDWLTTGPQVGKFEEAVAASSGARFGVAVSSGTAALHAALFAAGVGPGDEVIVPSLTFVADSNAVLYLGATPVFAEVRASDILIDVDDVARKLTAKTKAIVAVDYAGHPCDYDRLRELAKRHGVRLVADACHSIGGRYRGQAVGTLADLSVLSFHPVKHITTCEGGMILTDDEELARRMRVFRNHGITSDHRERATKGTLGYEMVTLGYNYRLNDVQSALGLSQLAKLPAWIERRNRVARWYDEEFAGTAPFRPLAKAAHVTHAYHLYVVTADFAGAPISRDELALRLKQRKIGVNVHYPPSHLHPYYRERFGYAPGALPVTEAIHAQILSLPMYPALTREDVRRVCAVLKELIGN